MLRITADVFSGRPNPAWEVRDEAEVRATLRALTADRGLLTEEAPARLGFRGFRVEPLGDELGADYQLGSSAYLALGAQAGAAELGQRLIGLIDRAESAGFPGDDALPLHMPLQQFLAAELVTATEEGAAGQATVADERGPQAAPPAEPEAAATCFIEKTAFNPGFWNNDPHVRYNNNCYNYASNWRTDTFAQPGRGCGSMYNAINCPEVTRAALCDGMHHRYHCFPDSERPRPLVALVVRPDGGDYHWYRLQLEDFWGHKPGGTEATNLDNSYAVIYNPETANRGPYTTFCGYFYGCNSQRQRIR